MVRLKDIAERASVSVMTVSKVLRDAKDISAETKLRVRKLAEEMGYVPDALAQSMRSGTTKLMGLIIPSVANPVFARVILAIEEKAHEAGYDLLIAHSLNNPEREEAAIRRMLARRVDGLFIAPAYRFVSKSPAWEELRKRAIPTVVLGQPAEFCKGFAHVETDDFFASQIATRHLLELGHKKIAFLKGPQASPVAQERFDGYVKAMREEGLEPDDHWIFSAGQTIEEGSTAALQIMNERPEITALIAFNDLVAIGAASTLLQQGVKIPEDLSVVGFGNILISEYFRVPLTTIRQPKLRLGITAFSQLVRIMRGEKAESVRLAAEIVVRDSTAAPKKS